MVIDGLEFLINIFRIILFKANPIKIRMMGKYIWLISVPTSKRSKGEISHSTEDFFSKTNLWDTNRRKKINDRGRPNNVLQLSLLPIQAPL